MQTRKGAFDLSGTKAALIVSLALTLPVAAQPTEPVRVQMVNQSSRQDDGKLLLQAPDAHDMVAGHTSHRSHSSHSSHSSHYSGSSGGYRGGSDYSSPSNYRPGSGGPSSGQGFDARSYDVKAWGPNFKLSTSKSSIGTAHAKVLSVQVPKHRPDIMPRTLVKCIFRYANRDSIAVTLENGTQKEYFCPGRVIDTLKMQEWKRETPMLVGLYAGMDRQESVVSAIPETVVKDTKSGDDLLVPSDWIAVSAANAPETIYKSPLGESFICIYDYDGGSELDVLFASKTRTATGSEQVALETGPCTLNLYEDSSSDWRVASLVQSRPGAKSRLFVFLCPKQDFPVLLGTFKTYLEQQSAAHR